MGREGETTIGDVAPATPRRCSLSFWEVTTASGVVLGFFVCLLCVYLTMPQSDYSFLKLPRNLQDLQILRSIFNLFFWVFIKSQPLRIRILESICSDESNEYESFDFFTC